MSTPRWSAFATWVPTGRLAVASARLFIGDAGRRAILAVCGVIAFRALTLEQMGHLSLAVSVATFLRFICGSGAPFVLRRDYRRDSPDRGALWSAAMVVSAGGLASCFLLAPGIALATTGPALALLLALVLTYHGAGAITDCYRSLHIADGESTRAALVDVVPAALLLALTLGVAASGRATETTLAVAYALAGLASIAVAAWLAVSPPEFRWPAGRALRAFARQSVPFLLEGVIVNAYFRLSSVLVYAGPGPDAVALFTTGQAIGLLFGMLPLNIGTAAFPRIVAAATSGHGALREVVRMLWVRTFLPGLLAVGVAVVSAPWWMPLLLGENGPGVVPHFACFAISRLAVFVSAPAIYALDSLRLQHARVWVSLTLLALVGALSFPAISAFGALGMSLTLAVAEFASAGIYVSLFLRATRSLPGDHRDR